MPRSVARFAGSLLYKAQNPRAYARGYYIPPLRGSLTVISLLTEYYAGVHLFTADSSATLSNNSAALVFNRG